MTHNHIIKKAAKHFTVTSDGRLSRNSLPYEMRPVKMGVGFDRVAKNDGYLVFSYSDTKDGFRTQLKTHRMIFFLVNGFLPSEIDHMDQDKLNNHPTNLRVATRSQNMMNSGSRSGSSSKYLGVSWHKGRNKWRSNIRINGSNVFLGSFKNEEDAAAAYNKAALERDSKFVNLNVITE